MKYLAPIALALPLLLAACSIGSDKQEPGGSAPSPTTNAQGDEAILGTLSDGVNGQVGFRHGQDCTDVDTCTTNFTVESLDVLDECDAHTMSDYYERPESTHLVKATVLVETEPESTYGQAPGEFGVWSEWSATVDGVTEQLPASEWCINKGTEPWGKVFHSGDTVRKVHYMDVPDAADKIQLTDSLTESRWIFDAPTEGGQPA